MELRNDFVVGVPIGEAWTVLTNVERIAPCMPGAELTDVDGDVYSGHVKVKVGPITAQYKGKASFVEKDDSAHKAVLKAEGRETRGQGNASALITATLTSEGDKTRVEIVTDLNITGRAAQFGRGVLADVSSKLIGQFVTCLETNVLGGASGGQDATVGSSATAGSSAASQAPAQAPKPAGSPPPEALNLLDPAVLLPVLKRVGTAVVGVVVGLKVLKKIFRRGKRS